MRLGALIAGGRSARFGRDKALAILSGRSLIEHAVHALTARSDQVVICGREWPGSTALADLPSGAGPLAGLNAALRYGADHGYSEVICAPVDVHPIDQALDLLLTREGCAVLTGQFSVGRWPTVCAARLAEHLAQGGRSLYGWLEVARPQRVDDRQISLVNINTESEFADVAARTLERG